MKRIVLGTAALLIGICHLTFANDSTAHTPTYALDTVIVVENKASFETPVSFSDILMQSIEVENTGQEPVQLLARTPSVLSHSDAGSYHGYSYMRIRGIDQTRINFSLDGIPLNETEDQGVYFSNYTDLLSDLNSLQIQRGVGTSSEGVASYGGSVRLQTSSFRNSGLNIESNYGSYNTLRMRAKIQQELSNGDGVNFRLSRICTDGYKHRSSNESTSGMVGYETTRNSHAIKAYVIAGAQKNQLAWIGVPLEEIRNDPTSNGNSQEDDEFSQALAAIHHTFEFKVNMNVHTSLFYNFLDGNYDFALVNYSGQPLLS